MKKSLKRLLYVYKVLPIKNNYDEDNHNNISRNLCLLLFIVPVNVTKLVQVTNSFIK